MLTVRFNAEACGLQTFVQEIGFAPNRSQSMSNDAYYFGVLPLHQSKAAYQFGSISSLLCTVTEVAKIGVLDLACKILRIDADKVSSEIRALTLAGFI